MKCDIKKGGSKKVSVWKKNVLATQQILSFGKKMHFSHFAKGTFCVSHKMIKYKQYSPLFTFHYYLNLIYLLFNREGIGHFVWIFR